jgi:predicted CxxxxCH...CXXCH cytochrome family protein
MRFTTVLTKMISVPLVLSALCACGQGRDSAPAMINAAGKHAVGLGYTNWVQQHWVEYKKANGGTADVTSSTTCSECHGADLLGGVSKVSCFSASFVVNGVSMSCHPNGDHKLGHPASWADPSVRPVQGFHGTSTFNFDANGQPAAVNGSTTLNANCGLCHATGSGGQSVSTAPSCLATGLALACHSSSPALKSSGCNSCHGVANGPDGAAAPNRPGAHAAHLSLNIGCKACHYNAGSGTANHATGKSAFFMNLSSAYLAENGAFGFAADGTCSGVSCHGGKQTPQWIGGALDLSDCTKCHATLKDGALPQFNDPGSVKIVRGKNMHALHLTSATNTAIVCASCHDATLLTGTSNHFAGIATPAIDGTPGNTLYTSLSYDTTTGSCSAPADPAFQCHPGAFFWK